MKTFGYSIIAMALLAGTATAADLYVPPVAPMMSEPASVGAFYASIFGGAAFLNDFDFVSSVGDTPGSMSFDTGYSVDGAIGYSFGNGLSVEGQVGYLSAAANGLVYDGNDLDVEGTASITYAMVNAWYGIDLGGVTPFIGAGIGAAAVSVDADFAFTTESIDDTQTTWAAQVGAGVSINVADNIALTGRYRYLTTGEVSLVDEDSDLNTGSASASIIDAGLKLSF
ncbi:Opacity protein [Devosia enhydra]|uniref:Opacity protein n=1 Tax=Devosia enhydra TaxID=665118 RepID=A0A1K2HT88_9HYPH|nr:outer membrane beta-barrel protein [Devosia enhydra]SFZ80943.1 Opacity protein [Devosia enhydra]